jgi:UDP-glucose 4-epimerase
LLESALDKQQQRWTGKNVLVTGGASFIGSHLVDKLVNLGANVTVIDNFSSGKLENLSESRNRIMLINKDLEYIQKDELFNLFRDQQYVFHLAAIHGGRGFISSHPADVCSNLSIDHHVIEASMNSNLENLVFASTACVYPTNLQKDIGSDYKLQESDSNPTDLESPMSADIEYGWGKLMTEIQLNSFKKQYGLKCCPVRFVTAYGPRENETHAIIALIYKAVEHMDPFEIWGNGQQERDFTYVEDIVSGTVKAAEIVTDNTPINLGTGTRYKIIDVVKMIFKILNWQPKDIVFDDSKPVGALSRALDNSRANQLLHWKPEYTLETGLKKTIDWYIGSHKIEGNIGNQKLFNH